MKNVLILGLVALLFVTLMAGAAPAQTTCNNTVGLYVAPEGTGPPRVTMEWLTPISLYLVLTRPTACETGYICCESINAFELAMRFDPAPDHDLFLTDRIYHPDPVNYVFRNDINEGVIDFCCGYAVDVPVTGDAVVLVELEFLPMGARTTEVYLEPLLTPAIEGEMSFCTGSPSDGIVMDPISGSHELPVFAFLAGPVPTEPMSFGQVKVLYR